MLMLHVSILLGQGDGTFATAQDFGVGVGPESVTGGDFNGDGRLDLATANFGADTVSILINTTVSEVAEVITFEGLEAGARITEVFGNRGSGPVFVQGTNPLLSRQHQCGGGL